MCKNRVAEFKSHKNLKKVKKSQKKSKKCTFLGKKADFGRSGFRGQKGVKKGVKIARYDM